LQEIERHNVLLIVVHDMESVKTENLSQFDPIDEVDEIEVCKTFF
jgi:hypothetical protein